MHRAMGDFRIDGMAMRYSAFVPRLYNWCLELGFAPERLMPSRAFCSDENQGFPIILLAKHFGTFPFNHGRAGGIVATDRHPPFAHHGADLVLIQASHVGFDPETGAFGTYRRLRTEQARRTATCGKICGVLSWYQDQYRRAQSGVRVGRVDGQPVVVIDNSLLDTNRNEGLILRLDRFVAEQGREGLVPFRVLSTAKVFAAANALKEMLRAQAFGDEFAPIGERLAPEMFDFRKAADEHVAGRGHLEHNLAPAMRAIVTAPWPLLDAARYNTQIEFDRTYRSIQVEPEYAGKNLLFVSGLHVDISPTESLRFPMTKFVPWAAYLHKTGGSGEVYEQEELVTNLLRQSDRNCRQMNLEGEIDTMSAVGEVVLPPLD